MMAHCGTSRNIYLVYEFIEYLTSLTFILIFFPEKKQELLIRGRKGNELEELWTFVVENNVAALETVCAVGMQTHDSEYNALGYSRLGIYVCRNADIAIQHALIKHASTQVIRLLVCKVRIKLLLTSL